MNIIDAIIGAEILPHQKGQPPSRNAVRRLIAQGAVTVNGVKIPSSTTTIPPPDEGYGHIVKCGRHQFMLV